jgi:energy-coupling factor transporter ATP-binding protein EcfA2
VIEVAGLTYTYPRTDAPALRGVDLCVPRGQFCAVAGANGAGKSTLCYALAGFVPHFYGGTLSGSVRVAAHDVARTPLADLASEVGLVFANPYHQITGMRFTVREEIAFGLENLGVPRDEMLERLDAVLRLTGLADLADRGPLSLSGGQMQRLALASVLVMRPRVLVLDEPAAQLDPAGTRELFAVLAGLAAAGDTTIVLVEHRLEWIAGFAERVVVLANGQVVADGPPRDVLAAPDLERHGVDPTRCTRVARLARARGLAPAGGPLPVTLDQAREFWS